DPHAVVLAEVVVSHVALEDASGISRALGPDENDSAGVVAHVVLRQGHIRRAEISVALRRIADQRAGYGDPVAERPVAVARIANRSGDGDALDERVAPHDGDAVVEAFDGSGPLYHHAGQVQIGRDVDAVRGEGRRHLTATFET